MYENIKKYISILGNHHISCNIYLSSYLYSCTAVNKARCWWFAGKSPDVQQSQSTSVKTVTAEEATVSNDTDDVQEEVVDENEANDIEEANESSDLKEADENLPGGGHEDLDSTEGVIDHRFDGVE